MLKDDLNKYIKNPSATRLTIILEAYNKKSTKKNIEALKLLIEDYTQDDLIEPVLAWLNPSSALPMSNNEEGGGSKTHPIIFPEMDTLNIGPPNEDDFILSVKRCLGDPLDSESLGNKVISGKLPRFNLSTYFDPQVLFDKFCMLANKNRISLDSFPRTVGGGNQGLPIWEVVVSGNGVLNRMKDPQGVLSRRGGI